MKVIMSFIFLSCNILLIYSQEDSLSITNQVFELGEVSISENQPSENLSTVRRSEIIQNNYQNVAEAMKLIPGITVNNLGARNENTVYLRGYDTRQIAFLIDGIPVYIPYDGNIDLGRFLSWNYEKIVVSKGFSSMLYGPNTMGGTINLITSVPRNKLEVSTGASVEFGNTGYNGNEQQFRIGSRLDKFFYQASFIRNDLEGWDLSGNFEETDIQEEGRRLNSHENDIGFTLRFGYVPDNKQRYVLSYSHQDGAKGIPVYFGNFRKRFWRMPEWDKRSLYFNSQTAIRNDTELKTRLFYDVFQNTLKAYDDESFSSQERNYAFNSFYDDYSLGGSMRLTNKSINRNEIALALLYKYDSHYESTGNDQDPVTEIADNNLTLALEDEYRLNDLLSFTGGISYSLRDNYIAREFYEDNSGDKQEFPSGMDHAVNYRLGLFFSLKNNQDLWLTTSRNSRFATMKERYSYRLGRIIPNPDLTSEKANHVNFGYRLNSEKLSIGAELFYSLGIDRITYVNITPDTIQFQNIEETRSMGLDLEMSYRILQSLNINLNYSFIHLENLQEPDFKFIYIPNHNLRISGEYKFAGRFTLIAAYKYISQTYSYSDGTYPVNGYGLTSLNFNAALLDNFLVRFSVDNLLDVNYYYSEGYPARGRVFNFGLLFTFTR